MIRFIIIVVLGFYSSFSLAQVNNTSKLTDSVRQNLAFELAQICGFDQGIRNEHLISSYGKELTKLLPAIDSLNFEMFIMIVKQYGYPTESLLGKYFNQECVRRVGYYILLHNSPRLVESEIYQLFRNEVLDGRLSAELFAMALDKYYVLYEERSLYNSLFKSSPRLEMNGVCITDKELSDSLRLDIGLPPLEKHEFIYKNQE